VKYDFYPLVDLAEGYCHHNRVSVRSPLSCKHDNLIKNYRIWMKFSGIALFGLGMLPIELGEELVQA